jgi:alpha-D-ribose 1-methylphosphonate 5-triphosphate diphosphatase PhnM
MTFIRITGGQVLLDKDGLVTTDLSLSDGRIEAIGGSGGKGLSLNAAGLLVLPGIVDIHGDASGRYRAAGYRAAVARQRHHHRVPRGHAVVGTGSARPGCVAGNDDRAGGGKLDL